MKDSHFDQWKLKGISRLIFYAIWITGYWIYLLWCSQVLLNAIKGGYFMEIYVLVKQVPDPEAIVKVKSDTELDIENKYFTSFFDEIAIEAGMKLKEKFGGKVTVLTADNKKVDALRRGISMGADEAVQITDPALEGSDLFGIAKGAGCFS